MRILQVVAVLAVSAVLAFACGGAGGPGGGCSAPLGTYEVTGTFRCKSGASKTDKTTMSFSTAADGGLQVTYGEVVPAQRTDCRVVASIRVSTSGSSTQADTLDLTFNAQGTGFTGTETLDRDDFYCSYSPDAGYDGQAPGEVRHLTGTKSQ